MASNEVIIKREGSVVIATLNRPGQLNALNKELFDSLKGLVDVLETDKSTRVLIFTGAGEKAFCVGADLRERQGMNEKDVIHRMEFVHKLYQRIERLPFPVIGALNGITLGGGFELALVCDLRIAAANATIGFPEVDLAIIPGNGGTQRLPRLIGLGRALELILMARKLGAEEAERFGIVHQVVPQGESLNQAKSWANRIIESGPIAIRAAKAALRMGMDRNLEAGLQLELEVYKSCLYSKDRMEGVKAFIEKRKPAFLGE